MGGGAFEPKTVVGVSKKAFYKKKKRAFTLAEVLITLAIIGVVAALTIPTVVAKYQQKAYYTAFMKSYNTLENVFELSINEYGKSESWSCDDQQCVLDNYLKQFLKTIPDPNVPEDLPAKTLHGTVASNYSALMSFPHVFLSDGSAIFIQNGSEIEHGNFWLIIIFDTNGIKAPNTIGRDIFVMEFHEDKLEPAEYFDNLEDRPGVFLSNCNPEKTSMDNGSGCAGRLLQEGKMDY